MAESGIIRLLVVLVMGKRSLAQQYVISQTKGKHTDGSVKCLSREKTSILYAIHTAELETERYLKTTNDNYSTLLFCWYIYGLIIKNASLDVWILL